MEGNHLGLRLGNIPQDEKDVVFENHLRREDCDVGLQIRVQVDSAEYLLDLGHILIQEGLEGELVLLIHVSTVREYRLVLKLNVHGVDLKVRSEGQL